MTAVQITSEGLLGDGNILISHDDESRNFVHPHAQGLVEARYVRRTDDYAIVYLSSQTGCAKGCRFCHLTQTAQTQAADLTVGEILAQADEVLSYYDELVAGGGCVRARRLHFNFMARGEPFSNHQLVADGDKLVHALGERGRSRGLASSIKISSIFPQDVFETGIKLTDIFQYSGPDIYYSLYSMDNEFRRRWLPRALDPYVGLVLLADWQRITRKIPVLHWAFIEGANDSEASIQAIIDAVNDVGLRCDVNIVRYNPYSDRQGREPEEAVIAAAANQLATGLTGARVQIVTRVGLDVAASCGMFVGGRHPRVEYTAG